MGNLKESSFCCGTNQQIKRKYCYDILLLITVVNITVGLVALYGYIGNDQKWTAEPIRREKVLAIAVFLFLSACALCWFIMRKEQQQFECERRILIIDRPPSYESCVSCAEPPPPSYFTVVNAFHIV